MPEETLILDTEGIQETLCELAHQIVNRYPERDQVVVVGVQKGGDLLSRRLANELSVIWGSPVPVGQLDVSMHRDDIQQRLVNVHPTDIPVDLHDKMVILVDDVLFSGRTTRAAMDTLNAFGRPKRILLAVLIDRGHRELPIRADFIGQELPTEPEDHINVVLNEEKDSEKVVLVKK